MSSWGGAEGLFLIGCLVSAGLASLGWWAKKLDRRVDDKVDRSQFDDFRVGMTKEFEALHRELKERDHIVNQVNVSLAVLMEKVSRVETFITKELPRG